MAYRIEKISIKQVGIEEPGKETIKTALVAVGSGSNQPRHASYVMSEKEFNALNDGVKIGSKKLKNKNGEICEVSIVYLVGQDAHEDEPKNNKEERSNKKSAIEIDWAQLFLMLKIGISLMIFSFFAILLLLTFEH